MRELNTVSHAIEIALREWGLWLPRNPGKMVRRPSVPQGRKRRLEDGEEERLLAACDRGRTPLLKQLVVLAIETGMRRGELLGLRWEHVHLAKRIVHLPLTKNGESRDVPLSRRATDTLTALSKHKRPNIDLVFPMTGNSVRLAFERLRTRAKMPDFHFHDLRHEAITRLRIFMLRFSNGFLNRRSEVRLLDRRPSNRTLISQSYLANCKTGLKV